MSKSEKMNVFLVVEGIVRATVKDDKNWYVDFHKQYGSDETTKNIPVDFYWTEIRNALVGKKSKLKATATTHNGVKFLAFQVTPKKTVIFAMGDEKLETVKEIYDLYADKPNDTNFAELDAKLKEYANDIKDVETGADTVPTTYLITSYDDIIEFKEIMMSICDEFDLYTMGSNKKLAENVKSAEKDFQDLLKEVKGITNIHEYLEQSDIEIEIMQDKPVRVYFEGISKFSRYAKLSREVAKAIDPNFKLPVGDLIEYLINSYTSLYGFYTDTKLGKLEADRIHYVVVKHFDIKDKLADFEGSYKDFSDKLNLKGFFENGKNPHFKDETDFQLRENPRFIFSYLGKDGTRFIIESQLGETPNLDDFLNSEDEDFISDNLNHLKDLNPNIDFDAYFGFYKMSENSFTKALENKYDVKGFKSKDEGYVFPVTDEIDEDFMMSEKRALQAIEDLGGTDDLLDNMWC